MATKRILVYDPLCQESYGASARVINHDDHQDTFATYGGRWYINLTNKGLTMEQWKIEYVKFYYGRYMTTEEAIAIARDLLFKSDVAIAFCCGFNVCESSFKINESQNGN